MNKFSRVLMAIGFIFSSFFLLSDYAKAQNNSSQSEKINLLTFKTIGGAWLLNSTESDDPVAKMQELVKKKSESAKDTENEEQMPPLTVSFFHPDKMLLVDSRDEQFVINEAYKEITQTRLVYLDGKARSFEIAQGAKYTVKAIKDNENLKIETVSPRGNKMIESFDIQPDGKKLKVTVRIENQKGEEIITLHRAYDRVILDAFSDDGN